MDHKNREKFMKKMKKKRRGPKPMSADQRREYRMQIPLNVAERFAVERSAAVQGLPVSVWARNRLLNQD